MKFVPLLAVAVAALPFTLRAEPSPVRVRVEQVAKSETEKHKKTQKRSLKVFVSNNAKEAHDFKIKYAIFARDIATKEIVTFAPGERPLSVGSLATEQADTPTITAVLEDEHMVKGKKVEAKGYKLIGQGVQVLNKEKAVVAESFDPPSLKEQFGKATPVTPEKKK